MTIQLRQICLVAEKLEPVIDNLTAIFGINRLARKNGDSTLLVLCTFGRAVNTDSWRCVGR
mgnify:CR=1 FL=1